MVSITLASYGLMRGLNSEEVEFLIEAIDRLAQSEVATYSTEKLPQAYAAFWKSKQDRAKRIATLATEMKHGS